MKRHLKKKLNADLASESRDFAAGQPEKLGRKDIADNIKHTVGIYYRKKRRAVFPELGLCKHGRLRADLFVLAMNGHTVVVEVKSSVADFRNDDKMELYLPFASQAYLAVTQKVFKKIEDDIDARFGVFILTDDGLRIKKVLRAKSRGIDMTVAANLAIRAAFRSMDKSNRKNKALV